MPKAKKTIEVNEGDYKVIFKADNQEQIVSGANLFEAFDKLTAPPHFKTTGIIAVEKNGKVTDRAFNVMRLKRFFQSKIMRDTWAKIMTI